jgi:PAS domain S-box-containing protein
MTLSPTTAYYIRRLIRQNLDQLQSGMIQGAGKQTDPLSDLNAVIQSLHSDPKDINATLFELERLVNFHKGLSGQTGIHQKELAEVEKRMFWLLGFRFKKPEHRGTVLIVDDMPENLRLLTQALTNQGYTVSCAISGPMALNAIHKISPDLILLDIRMPGMDGYEVCQQLKSSTVTQDVPILFVSASDDVSDKVKAFEMGGADYVTKPFQIEEVLARIHHQLRIRDLQRRLEEQNVALQQQMGHPMGDRPSQAPSSPTDIAHDRHPIPADMQALMAKLPVVIHRYCLDECWTTLYINDAIYSLVGVAPDEFTTQQRNWIDTIHPVDRQAITTKIHEAVQNNTAYALEFRVLHKDGSVRWVYQQGWAEIDDEGSVKHIDSTLVDISPCKKSLASI